MPPKAPKAPKKTTSPSKNTLVVDSQLIEQAKERMLKTGDGLIGPKLNFMLKSRFRIIYVRSYEERRVIDFFRDVAIYQGLELFQWDCNRGLLSGFSNERVTVDDNEVNEEVADPILAHILDCATKQSISLGKNKKPRGALYLLLDFHYYLTGEPTVERKLKQFADLVSVSTIVIIAPTFVCPSTLEKEITLVDFPVPSYDENKQTLRKLADTIVTQLPDAAKQAHENEEDLVKAVSGLTTMEAENAYGMSVVCHQGFDIQTILDEKKQMIKKGGILEYRDPRFTLDDVGGLDTLKDWLNLRRVAFREDARDFGLPVPKGLLLIGIPGCVLGKTKIRIKKVSDEGKHQIFVE